MGYVDAQNINLLANVGINDADPIGTWKNAAPTGATYDLIQGLAGRRPTFRLVADGVKINGKSAVESTDGLRHLTTAGFTLVNQPLSWGMVWRSTVAGTQVPSTGGAANTNQIAIVGTAPSLYAGASQSPALSIAANTWETTFARFDAAASTWTVNGSTVSGFGTLGTLGIDQIGVFWNPSESGGVGMIGFIAELAIWTTAPTTAEWVAYVTAKYGATPQ